MATYSGTPATLSASSVLFHRLTPDIQKQVDLPEKISNQLSGIIINQNAPYFDSNKNLININSLNQILNNNYPIFKTVLQEFKLPTDFKRRSSTGTSRIPNFTGFQIHLNANTDNFQFSYTLQVYNKAKGWQTLLKDIATGSQNGDQWFLIKFAPFSIDEQYLDQKFRIFIKPISGIDIFYLSSTNPFILNDCYCYIDSDLNDAQLSGKTTASDVKTAALISGALRFRLLGDVADSGIDFLGNSYRSLVNSTEHSVKNVLDLNTDTYWLSKANPSKYAVENLYFDLSFETTIAAIYLDPVTPNIKFNVYYSNEDPSSESIDDLDMILWNRVPKEFTATKAQNYIFPNPIHARYLKIEFTHLQASSYISRDFQKPIVYKKHPQWVFDYFISWYNFPKDQSYNPFTSEMIDVNFDVLNLAYNYYKGDILESSNGAELTLLANDSVAALNQKLTTFLTTTNDNIKNIDSATYFQINTDLNAFFNVPSDRGLNNDLIHRASGASMASENTSNYPTEDLPIIAGDTTIVSTKDRNHLIQEKTLPQMYFFLECRHKYREAIAKLEDGKAYFAGVKEIAFQRYDHSIKSDDSIYMSVAGDTLNFIQNDFKFSNLGWVAK